MSGEPGAPKQDGWSSIHAPREVARAAERLAAYASAPSEIAARHQFLERLDLSAGARVLDVGAGSGLLALDVAVRVAPRGKVIALDASAPLLAMLVDAAHARDVTALVETCVADAREMPLADDAVDRALSHWVLLHIEHPERVIAEMVRVVRPGGIVMCVEADWDTAIVHPGERAVTRSILRANCDRHVDGTIGRRLVPRLRAAGLEHVECLPIVDVDDGSRGPTWRDFLRERALLAVEANAVTATEAQAWWAAIDAAYRAGAAFFSFTQFAVWGRKRAR